MFQSTMLEGQAGLSQERYVLQNLNSVHWEGAYSLQVQKRQDKDKRHVVKQSVQRSKVLSFLRLYTTAPVLILQLTVVSSANIVMYVTVL